MLTARGWWLLIASVLLAVIGATSGAAPVVAILGITLLAWLIGEWILFAFRARFALPELVVERRVMQSGRPVSAGWANVPFQIRFQVFNRSRYRCPLVNLVDCGRVNLRSDGSERVVAVLPPHGQAEGNYILHPMQPGMLYLSGVIVRMSDLNGFFRAERFIRSVTSIAVLPKLTDDEGRQRADKRYNALPPPGTHRLRMPGSGSELLDLRDYRPGDPPKMIAWKPSARRDRLITKEFESEVPVRCVLFLDVSNGVRLGRGEATPLAKLASTAAGILLAATANRDLVGIAFFDAAKSRAIAPARTSSHATRLLNELAHAAAKLPDLSETNPAVLVKHLEPAMHDRMPEQFDRSANALPWGLYWRPLLDKRWGWLIALPYLLGTILAAQSAWLEFAARTARALNPETGRFFVDLPVFFAIFTMMLFLPSTLASLFWLGFGLRGFLPAERRQTRRRKQIAAIFAAMDRDSPAAIERYQWDDVAFAERAGRYFSEERIRVPVRRFDRDGTDRFRELPKLKVLAKSLVRATSRARDNELYVLLVDLLDLADDLDAVLRAARLARTRHHHILVIIAWPNDIPVDPPEFPANLKTLEAAVHRAVIQGVWRRYEKLRRSFTQAGATVLRLTDRDTVRTVLDHLDRLRGARSRR